MDFFLISLTSHVFIYSSFLIPLVALLAFYLAFNLGGNDVANSMGTSVGSKAVTLKQAIIIAGVLEFTGAVLFGKQVSSTLATQVANPSFFAATPKLLILGMVAVLIACGLWLQIATSQGLPVASSHAVIGAIAGFSWVAAGKDSIDWTTIGTISLAWVITPFVSGGIAIIFYTLIRYWIIEQPDSLGRLNEWIPWLSSVLIAIFGVIVFPTVFNTSFLSFPAHDVSLTIGGISVLSITIASWKQLEGMKKQKNEDLKQNKLEAVLARFQVISASFVAFAHGSNDVGNAIAPLALIVDLSRTGTVPTDNINIPLWILIIGGSGIVAGLAIQGKKVITTVGENIISLQPSSGFSAELATATTILLASKIGLPVSTSHALVGGVIGIGIIKGWQNINFSTVKSVVFAWLITLPITGILGGIIFSVLAKI